MNFPNRQLSLMYEVLLLGNVVMEVEERDDLYIAMGSARPATPSPPTPPSPPPYWRWTNMNQTGQVLTPSGLGGRGGPKDWEAGRGVGREGVAWHSGGGEFNVFS